jgi:hypothetical protein
MEGQEVSEKRYRLLKDMPRAKAGEIIVVPESDGPDGVLVCYPRHRPGGIELPDVVRVPFTSKEWFEEVKEPELPYPEPRKHPPVYRYPASDERCRRYWANRDHASFAERAHAALDVVLRHAINRAALPKTWMGESAYCAFCVSDAPTAGHEHEKLTSWCWPTREAAEDYAALLKLIAEAKP